MFLPLFCFLQSNVCKNVNNTLGIKINMCCTKRYNTYNSTTCGSSYYSGSNIRKKCNFGNFID